MGHLLVPTVDFPPVEQATSGRMRVIEKSVYRGPHLHSHTPMVRIQVNLGELENWPTDKLPEFKNRLLELLPSLHEHGCCYGEPGGFVRRLTHGTWLGHVSEHIALELQVMAGMEVSRGKTRSVKGNPGVYNIMYAYAAEKVGILAGRYALEIVNSILPSDLSGIDNIECLAGDRPAFSTVETAIQDLKDIAGRERLGPTTRSIVEAAAKRGIPAMRLDDNSMVQLGWGKYQRRIRASITDKTSQIAVDAAGDKELTKKLLAAVGAPVPQGKVVRSVEGAAEAANQIGYPVTIKPLDGNHGRGVTTNIGDEAQARLAFDLAITQSRRVLVEQNYSGKDYRILVVNGKVVAVSERVPAHVIGDGKQTIEALINILNTDPRRGGGHEEALSKVVVDQLLTNTLARSGLSLESIPAQGRKVLLRDTANLSTGGTAIDRTDDIHLANTILMERAAQAIGLDIAGIDLVTPDVALPIAIYGGGIVEINAAPGFRMHLHPTEGRARPVGEAVISILFPEDKPARVPIVAITGTNGKSTTARMVSHILRQNGHCVGLTSTSGIYINDTLLLQGDCSGPQSARAILQNPAIDYAVLETARGGLLREGLAFDYCDAGAVLNVTEDHLGIKGINTLEDLAALKSVVTESVKKSGVSILNADDPIAQKMAEVAGGKICFFSMYGGRAMDEKLRIHIEQGGMAVIMENWSGQKEIVIHSDGHRLPVIDVKEIPSTHGGIVGFNIQNALAAAGLAFGLGVDVKTISKGLKAFVSSYEENPGRMNVFDGHGFRTIMDYAHNPAALKALIDLLDQIRDDYNCVIGSISTPGDRRDEDIREMGRIAAGGFDFLVFRESPDERGRKPGEVMRLLAEGARSVGFSPEKMVCVRTEEEAADICLKHAKHRDLVIVTPTDVTGIWDRVLNFKPQFEGLSIDYNSTLRTAHV